MSRSAGRWHELKRRHQMTTTKNPYQNEPETPDEKREREEKERRERETTQPGQPQQPGAPGQPRTNQGSRFD
jgi:hypothetical protein